MTRQSKKPAVRVSDLGQSQRSARPAMKFLVAFLVACRTPKSKRGTQNASPRKMQHPPLNSGDWPLRCSTTTYNKARMTCRPERECDICHRPSLIKSTSKIEQATLRLAHTVGVVPGDTYTYQGYSCTGLPQDKDTTGVTYDGGCLLPVQRRTA